MGDTATSELPAAPDDQVRDYLIQMRAALAAGDDDQMTALHDLMKANGHSFEKMLHFLVARGIDTLRPEQRAWNDLAICIMRLGPAHAGQEAAAGQ